MKINSVKQRGIKTTLDDEQDFFDNLIRISRTAYTPNPTGSRMHTSLARTRICRGGLGSGKSRAGTEHVNHLALTYPGSTHFIGRKDLTSLKETTQKEFLEKVVDSATIDSFHVNDNKLFYKNGSQVLFRETKEPDKVKSLELTSYLIDEADENDTAEIWEKIDDRLRQKILIDGQWVEPPFAGLLIFNPVDDQHWLYALANRTDIDVQDFQFSTYENIKNLPQSYIPNLLAKLPPWEIDRLVHGNWGRVIRGRPVYHGFTREMNVRPLKLNPSLPLLRGWDFGYNHPAVRFAQLDPVTGRYFVLREFLGNAQHLQDTRDNAGQPKLGVVSEVTRITKELAGEGHPIFDYGDPHGADKKDTGLSSIEYLRIHHGIHVISRREVIKTGMDEVQHKISTVGPMNANLPEEGEGSLFLVDPSCKTTITAYEGGYHRDETGEPVKDGTYDHLPDTDRYIIVNTMNSHLRHFHRARRYKPRNKFTGY
jgi:hypothetical protein